MLAAALVTPGVAFGAVDIYLKLTGIKGGSRSQTDKDSIDVLAYSSGLSNGDELPKPAGALRDIAITKFVDNASIPILLAAAEGKPIAEATFVFRLRDEVHTKVYEVKCTDVLVVGVSTGANGESDLEKDFPIELVTLRVKGMITWTYTPYNPGGMAGEPIEGSYRQ